MKKTFFALVATLALFSCSPNDDVSEQNKSVKENVSQLKIDNVLKMTDTETQRVAYQFLNSGEKQKLWNDKLSNILEKQKLSSKQDL